MADRMELKLENIVKRVGAEPWLYPFSLAPVPGEVTVLLGATQAGKTTMMRLMAGLDAPSEGRIVVDGHDVTGVPVRQRNVAMVYQQFINYPSMTVFDNIASPLRLARAPDTDARVRALAKRLHIEPFLSRLPAELSGGQQQRVALARALAKRAPLMLLDEPLVNLDYKLREELRDELTQLFAGGNATVVYATTEPGEALLLGGHCAVLDAGELLQYGPTADVFRRPRSLRVARAFSDPPLNLLAGEREHTGVRLAGAERVVAAGESIRVDLSLPETGHAGCTVGWRAGTLRLQPRPGDISLPGTVDLTELSGSDSFVHLATELGGLVAQLTGVHEFEPGTRLTLHAAPADAYVFDAGGALLRAPAS
jgi:glycerol transport system ATP-binding protein